MIFWRFRRVRRFIWTEIQPQWFIFKNAQGVSINRSTDKTKIRAWTTIKWPAMRQMFVYSQEGSILYTRTHKHTHTVYIDDVLYPCPVVWNNLIYLLGVTNSTAILYRRRVIIIYSITSITIYQYSCRWIVVNSSSCFVFI